MKRSSSFHDDQTYRYAIILGIAIGGIVFIGGLILCILGLSGSMHLILQQPGLTAKLTNASPGAVSAMLGTIIIWRFKPKIVRTVETKNERIEHKDFTGGTYTVSTTFKNESSSGARL